MPKAQMKKDKRRAKKEKKRGVIAILLLLAVGAGVALGWIPAEVAAGILGFAVLVFALIPKDPPGQHAFRK